MAALTLQMLLEIEIPSVATPLLLQNYQTDPLVYEGKTYEYGSFEFQVFPDASLDLHSPDGSIWIRNTSAIRSLVDQYNGLEKAVVTATHIRIDSSREPYVLLSQVYSSGPDRSYYVFNLSTPTSALEGRLVNQFFSRREFPELVFYRPN